VQRQLVGSYFLSEYSFEASALFNPSIVAHPDQTLAPKGGLRFILSLRAVGEGHISSITFRAGTISRDGSVTIDPTTRRITGWQAEPWPSGGSAAIVLAHPDDAALQQKVSLLLAKLAADPKNGIDRVIDKGQIETMGGSKGPSFWVDFKIGYAAGLLRRGPLVTPSRLKGTHGYFPTHPEMHATFMIMGPDVPAHASLGEIDMRSIAPTLAKLLGVPLPSATAKPLF